MKLIRPSYEIMAPVGPDLLRHIELCGRVCYKSEERVTEDSYKEFIRNIIKRGHESVLEHAGFTVRFICDRGVSHELVRHRLASISQESTRYCDYGGGGCTFVIPPWLDLPEGEYVFHQDGFLVGGCPINRISQEAWAWLHARRRDAEEYQDDRDSGWSPQQARGGLPNATKTEVIMTANFREWRHALRLRVAPAAHPQMRELMRPLLAELQERAPIIFDDITV